MFKPLPTDVKTSTYIGFSWLMIINKFKDHEVKGIEFSVEHDEAAEVVFNTVLNAFA